jgi:hypothetical protein
MCDKVTVLAKAGATRYVARCEHGTVHVVWDNVSLRLSGADFIRITQDACTRAQSLRADGKGEEVANFSQEGLHFNLKTVTVTFEPNAMPLLRDLMCLAALNMDESYDTLRRAGPSGGSRLGRAPGAPALSIN